MPPKKIPYILALAATLIFLAKLGLVGGHGAYRIGLDALLTTSSFFFCLSMMRRGLPVWTSFLMYLLLTFNPYTYSPDLLLLNEKFAASLILLILSLFIYFCSDGSRMRVGLFSILFGLGTAGILCCSRYPIFALTLLAYGSWLCYRRSARVFCLPTLLPVLLVIFVSTLVYFGMGSWPYSGKNASSELWSKTLTPSAPIKFGVSRPSLLGNVIAETAAKTVTPFPPEISSKIAFEVSGWVFGVKNTITEVSLRNSGEQKLAATRTFLPRPDVQGAFQGAEYPLVPLAVGFKLRPSIPYYSKQGILIVLTDDAGREYRLPAEQNLIHHESYVITIEKSEKQPALMAKKNSTTRWNLRLNRAHEWISRRLFFFFLAALVCLLFPRKYPDSVSLFFPTVLLLTIAVISAGIQIPFTFLPGDFLVRPQEVFLLSLIYPVLAVLVIYLASRKIRESLPVLGTTSHSPVKFFIVGAGIFGGLLILAMPPFQAADEGAHFFKAYQISEWNLFSTQVPPSLYRVRDQFDYLPFRPDLKTSVKQILEAKNIELNPEESGTAPVLNYSPIAYLPASVSILAGRLVELPPLFLTYIGRTGSLIAYILLVAWAIRLMPIQKWVLALFALTPMCMAQAAAVTVDTVTLAISFLTFAYILHLSLSEATLRSSQWIRLGLLLVLVSLTKPVYFVLSFLYLLIPKEKAGSHLKYWGGLLGLVALSVVTAKGWIWINQRLQTYDALGTSGNQQLSLILHHPVDFFHILCNTFSRYGAGYLEHMIGRLGWLDTGLPNSFRLFYLTLLIMAAVFGWSGAAALSRIKRLLILLTVGSGVLLIAVFLFLTWTPIGSPTIEGIQGRYFLPLVPPFLLMIYPARDFLRFSQRFPPFELSLSAAFLATATTLGSILVRYYWAI